MGILYAEYVIVIQKSLVVNLCFVLSSRRRHTRWPRDWSSDVCSSDLEAGALVVAAEGDVHDLAVRADRGRRLHAPLRALRQRHVALDHIGLRIALVEVGDL